MAEKKKITIIEETQRIPEKRTRRSSGETVDHPSPNAVTSVKFSLNKKLKSIPN